MEVNELIVGFVIVALAFFTVMHSAKNPDNQNKKIHYRSFKSPVVSNAELFDTFNRKSELTEDDNNDSEIHDQEPAVNE